MRGFSACAPQNFIPIARVPIEIKQRYLTAFDVDPKWLIECGSWRQKWIDMGQSLNLYLADPIGKKLNDMYFSAWRAGLKTTYYLRTLAATQVEKSALDINRFGIQPRWMKNQSASGDIKLQREDTPPEANPSITPSDESCPSMEVARRASDIRQQKMFTLQSDIQLRRRGRRGDVLVLQ